MLFISTLPVGYMVVWLEPSWHCGPFRYFELISDQINLKRHSPQSGLHRMPLVLTKFLENSMPDRVNKIIDYLSSPGAVIPILMLLILIIYYLFSTIGSLKDANSELKNALRKEKEPSEDGRPEGHDEDVVFTPGLDKKHVRISDEIVDDSDKTKLIPKK